MGYRYTLIARNTELSAANPLPKIIATKYNGNSFFTQKEISAIVAKHGGRVNTGLSGQFAAMGFHTSAQRMNCAREISGLYPEFAMLNSRHNPIELS